MREGFAPDATGLVDLFAAHYVAMLVGQLSRRRSTILNPRTASAPYSSTSCRLARVVSSHKTALNQPREYIWLSSGRKH